MPFGRLARLWSSTLMSVMDGRARFRRVRAGAVVVGRDVQGLKHATFAGHNAVGSGAIFAGAVTVGYGTTIGSNSYMVGPIAIGNYCQLGPAVGIYGRDHPTTHVTMYFNQHLFDGRLQQSAIDSAVRVGHDVWVGHGAVLLKGVQVGDGAVIGAGSVVTKNVPEYTIVAGNPAAVIRRRFDDDVIGLLRSSRWWLRSAAELAAFEDVFHLDLRTDREAAVGRLNDMVAQLGRAPQ